MWKTIRSTAFALCLTLAFALGQTTLVPGQFITDGPLEVLYIYAPGCPPIPTISLICADDRPHATIFLRTGDAAVVEFRVLLTYELDGQNRQLAQTLTPGRNRQWTWAHFWLPHGAKPKGVTVESFARRHEVVFRLPEGEL